jgi:hypothetical protein
VNVLVDRDPPNKRTYTDEPENSSSACFCLFVSLKGVGILLANGDIESAIYILV